ncbi:MAG: ribosome biogenesis GTP-binding protein YihA/YsxC [bacterium]
MSEVQFVKSVFHLPDLPKENISEVVLCGRSNVGKSTFINSFFNKKNLAKVSSTPGKTRSINYYLVENKYYVVDLPGFGYAKIAKTERESWEKLISGYLKGHRNISFVFHFIDSRIEPTKLDHLLYDFIKSQNLNYIAVLSKVDKLKQSELAEAKRNISKAFSDLVLGENLFLHSGVKGTGKNEINKLLVNYYYPKN